MKNSKKIFALIFTVVSLSISSLSQTTGTRTEYNNNAAELIKRGSIEVDPTTNALNITIPIQEYPGRGGSFPVTLNYNSKVWRTSPQGCWQPPNYPDHPRQRLNSPFFSEHSNAGWTSSLSVPYIEADGGSFTVWIDDNNVMQNNEQTGMPVDCGDEPTDSGCFENDPDCIFTPLTYGTTRILVHMPGGSTHELRQNDTAYFGGGVPNGIYSAVDGSRLKYDPSTQTLWLPDGSRYLMDSATEIQYLDQNGNKMTFNRTTHQWTDTLGRLLPAFPAESLNLPKVGGAAQYQLHWELLSDSLTNPNEQLAYAGSNSYSGSGPIQNLDPYLFGGDSPMISAPILFNPQVLSQIDLPNGQSYKFSYNKYAEIDKIVLPTGGYKRYRYAMVPAQEGGLGLGNSFEVTNRGVVEMWESPNGDPSEENLHHWTFSSDDSPFSFYTTTTTAPDGTYTVRKVHGYDSSSVYESPHFGFNHILDGRSLDEKLYNSEDELRGRTLYTWAYDGPVYDPAGCTNHPCESSPFNAGGYGPPPARNARLASKIEIIVDSGGALAKTTTYEYDADLNVTAVNENDYVVISPATAQAESPTIPQGSLLRRQETTYLVNDPNYNQATRDAYRARNLVALPTSTRLKDGALNTVAQTATAYDETSLTPTPNVINWTNPGTGAPRGNPTTASQWLNVPAGWLTSETAYDQAGNPVSVTDARGKITTIIFEDSFTDDVPRNSYAFPTRVITPVPDSSGLYGAQTGLSTSTKYDFNTGLVISMTDPNGQTTTNDYADPLNRLKKITDPTGREIIFDYGAGAMPTDRWVKVKSQIDVTKWKEALSWFDGFGRTVRSQLVDDDGDIVALTCYDSMGRASKVSNPFRGYTNQDCTTTTGMEWTVSTFDAAGRPWKRTTSDSAVVETTYGVATSGGQIGTVVTIEDQADKLRRTITNAVGQLIRVDEPDNSSTTGSLGPLGSPYQPTLYSYNPLGKMVHVQQGVQHRYFMYDSLGRLLRVKQPEQDINTSLNTSGNPNNNSWTAGFTYDENGNVLTAKDAKGTTITNTYDALNRPLTRTYSDGTPAVTYYYDGNGIPSPTPEHTKGKLTRVSSSVSDSRYAEFDEVGRLTEFQQITDGQTYTSSYEYNLSGALTKETYPSGRVVENEFDANGDLAKIFGKATPTAIERTYASNLSYTPDGKIQRLRLGSGVWESAKLNSRLQVKELSVGWGPSSSSIWKMTTEFGELQTNGTVDATKNSGNIGKQTVTFDGLAHPFVQAFTYDSLQRLTEAKETVNGTQTWREVFDYDRYGNRLTHQKFNGTTEVTNTDETHPAIDSDRNRFEETEGYTFDANGNVIVDFTGRQFTFNGDNKQTEVMDSQDRLVGTYFYDGEGKRVKKLTYDEFGDPKDVTVFVYSGARLIAEYSTEAPPQNPTTRFTVTDQLGSPRVILDSAGDVLSRRDFLPFGEEIDPDGTYRTTNQKYGQEDQVRQKFTGYEHDKETGLDFAEARMYESRHGRFTAVDPLLASGKSADPQTFNRYVYVMNNPLVLSDPTGLQAGTYYKDLGKGRWALANYRKDGEYKKYEGPARLGTGADGTRLRITSKGWRPVDDVAAAQASSTRGQPAGSSSDPINTALLNDLGRRGPALEKIAIGLAALMASPAAGPLLPTATGVAGAAGSAATSAPISVTGPLTMAATFLTGTGAANLADDSSDNPNETSTTLHRGVTVGHPGYENALRGIAIPIGGPATPEQHNEGDTRSIYTSWTTSEATATMFATASGNGGVVMTANIPESRQVVSPDRFRENEVLVTGTVTGAQVRRIP